MGGARCPVRFFDNSLKFHRRPFLGAAKLRIIFETQSFSLDYFHSCCIFVSFHRYLVGYSLMTATVVVVLDVIPDALSQARHIVLRVDIDILRLDGTPETLYPDIVLAASTAIHADFDTQFLASRQPQVARILATLVGVDDLRCAMGFHGPTEHLNAILLVQRVMQPPGHDTATVDVYYRRDVHEPVQHRYIGDVNAPDIIGTGDVEPTEQVRHPVLRLAKLGQVFLRIYGCDVHLAHQPADTLRTDKEPQQEQVVNHALHTLGGMLCVFPVYRIHQLKILSGFALGLVVVSTLAEAEKLQLAVHAQTKVGGY